MKNGFQEMERDRLCINCLNFHQIGTFHHSETIFKAAARYVIIGECKFDGLQVSQWCTCQNWQDDA